jgi:hypothetical protein
MKGGGAMIPTGVEIINKNTVRSFVKIVAKRKKKKNDFNAR